VPGVVEPPVEPEPVSSGFVPVEVDPLPVAPEPESVEPVPVDGASEPEVPVPVAPELITSMLLTRTVSPLAEPEKLARTCAPSWMSESVPFCPSFVTFVLGESMSFLSLFARVSWFDSRSNRWTVPVSSFLLLDALPIAPVVLSVDDEPVPIVSLVLDEPVPVVEESVEVEPAPVDDEPVAVPVPVPVVSLEPLDVEPVEEPVPIVSWLLPVLPLDWPDVELLPVAPVPWACAAVAAARMAAAPRPAIVPHLNHFISSTLRRSV